MRGEKVIKLQRVEKTKEDKNAEELIKAIKEVQEHLNKAGDPWGLWKLADALRQYAGEEAKKHSGGQ